MMTTVERLFRTLPSVSLGVAVLALAACETTNIATAPPSRGALAVSSPSTRLAYAMPREPASAPLSVNIPGSPSRSLDSATALLRQAGLRIDQADPELGIVVARYAGDPSRFVDCGTITATDRSGRTRQVEAEAPSAVFDRRSGFQTFAVQRDLDLHARLVLRALPSSTGTWLFGVGTYVLTKQVSVPGDRPRTETIAFESGQTGRFAKGTVCAPNGLLEQLAVPPPGT
ncbi:hypothetical protein N825_34065 [Skermanella stibiiresistens SB22]|uniref:Uncharacterized protein n=1 Tax=Skermanella stibiiresistens SB22 TaxID=1385369 RepID=W9GPM0_9PROT|nr:hypothetical protein [Skermanella stibiiresistens]EWY35840.1 hypothetical protein N825_34065 [Skermanella stibiiresistens SB22]